MIAARGAERRLAVRAGFEVDVLGLAIQVAGQQLPQYSMGDDKAAPVAFLMEPSGAFDLIAGKETAKSRDTRILLCQPGVPEVNLVVGEFQTHAEVPSTRPIEEDGLDAPHKDIQALFQVARFDDEWGKQFQDVVHWPA